MFLLQISRRLQVLQDYNGAAHIFNESYQAKPAYDALVELLTPEVIPGSLSITISMVLDDPVNQTWSGLDETFIVSITGPSYPSGIDITFTLIDGVINSTNSVVLSNLIPGSYTIEEADAGTE